MNDLNRSLQDTLQKNKMTLIVSLPENNVELAKAAIDSGADGVKLHVNVDHRASGNTFGSSEQYEEVFTIIRDYFKGPFGIVPGGSLEQIKEEELQRLIKVGFNYYSIYAHHLPSWLLNLEQIEKTFAITNEYPLGLLGHLKKFGYRAIETSIIPGEEYGTPLTFKDILVYKRIVEKVDIPVLVPSQRKLVPADVTTLSNVGVNGIMLGAIVLGNSTESVKSAVSSFREAIDTM